MQSFDEGTRTCVARVVSRAAHRATEATTATTGVRAPVTAGGLVDLTTPPKEF